MSASLYETALSFLEGDQGDVRQAVNAQLPGALGLGSVVTARATRARQQRRENAPSLTIEIVPVAPWAAREIGIGYEERDLVFELKTTLRRKDLSAGRAQLATVGEIARALVARYDARSNLTLLAQNAALRYARAELVEIDDAPESHELARSVVRLTLTFTCPQGDNS